MIPKELLPADMSSEMRLQHVINNFKPRSGMINSSSIDYISFSNSFLKDFQRRVDRPSCQPWGRPGHRLILRLLMEGIHAQHLHGHENL